MELAKYIHELNLKGKVFDRKVNTTVEKEFGKENEKKKFVEHLLLKDL